MKIIKIAPSILSADFARLGEQVVEVEEAGADLLHIDVMDGHFVPNLTIGPLVVSSLRKITKLPLDVHLMIDNPDVLIPAFIDAGADMITVHTEVCYHLHRTIHMIKESGVKAGAVLNPGTPLSFLEHVLPDVDMILLMSVNPGFGGQKFIPQVLSKISNLHKIIEQEHKHIQLEVDGGIKLDNARTAASAGADILVAGSAIFGTPNPGEALKQMKAKLTGL